jgi:hypothetical protein
MSSLTSVSGGTRVMLAAVSGTSNKGGWHAESLSCIRAMYHDLVYPFRDNYIPVFLARAEAVNLGNQLFKHHFFHHVTFDHEFKDEKLFYRLLGDGFARALNAQLSYACIPRPGNLS